MGFFDDLTKKASETYKNTAEKTNKLTKEMKLKSQMNDNKAKITKLYGDIGKIVYEKYLKEENIDVKIDLIEEITKIDVLAKEIEDLGVEIRALKGIRLCDNCASEIMVNAKFCPKCGAQQEEIKIVENVSENVETVNNTVVNNDTTVEETTNNDAPVAEIIVKDEGVVDIKSTEE